MAYQRQLGVHPGGIGFFFRAHCDLAKDVIQTYKGLGNSCNARTGAGFSGDRWPGRATERLHQLLDGNKDIIGKSRHFRVYFYGTEGKKRVYTVRL